jgi:hypothetical protein
MALCLWRNTFFLELLTMKALRSSETTAEGHGVTSHNTCIFSNTTVQNLRALHAVSRQPVLLLYSVLPKLKAALRSLVTTPPVQSDTPNGTTLCPRSLYERVFSSSQKGSRGFRYRLWLLVTK